MARRGKPSGGEETYKPACQRKSSTRPEQKPPPGKAPRIDAPSGSGHRGSLLSGFRHHLLRTHLRVGGFTFGWSLAALDPARTDTERDPGAVGRGGRTLPTAAPPANRALLPRDRSSPLCPGPSRFREKELATEAGRMKGDQSRVVSGLKPLRPAPVRSGGIPGNEIIGAFDTPRYAAGLARRRRRHPSVDRRPWDDALAPAVWLGRADARLVASRWPGSTSESGGPA